MIKTSRRTDPRYFKVFALRVLHFVLSLRTCTRTGTSTDAFKDICGSGPKIFQEIKTLGSLLLLLPVSSKTPCTRGGLYDGAPGGSHDTFLLAVLHLFQH